MAKFRKTIPVDALLDYANGYLAADYQGGDDPASVARRTGMIDLLEATLLSAGRYCGYSYLDDKVITKSKPGIRWVEGQAPKHTFHETDCTRRRYA
jgi:hypothetical protein